MDKLKPVIKQHYWICFGLSVIFVVTGWWLASSNLAKATEDRKKAVDESFSKANQGGDAPNVTWIEAARKVNEKDAKAYEGSANTLWQRQKDARIWHKDLQEEIKNVPFQGTITRASTRDKWGKLYGKQFDELLAIVNPFVMKDGTGLVVVDQRRVTSKPYDTWRYKRPVSDEVWKNQEDIWLLKSLLTSIARVNEGAVRITDAPLREIVALRLRGGDREYVPSAAGAGGFGGGEGFGMGGADSEMGMGSSMGFGGDGGMMGGRGLGDGAAGGGPWKAFEGSFGTDILNEEFGPVAGAAGAAGGMGGFGGFGRGSMGMESGGEADGGMLSGGGGGFGGDAAGAAPVDDRYVDDADTLPYKTRGFYLHVKMRWEQIPRLLAELCDSDFPVEIVRVDLRTSVQGNQSGGAEGYMSGGDMSGGGLAEMGLGGMGMGMGEADGGLGADPGLYGDLGGASGLSGVMMGSEMMGRGGMGEESGLGDIYGGGDIYGSNNGGFGMAGSAQQSGKLAYAAAMSDPGLIELRVGGLMTLYQSREEAIAQDATEAAVESEAGSDPAPAPGEADSSSTAPVDPSAPAGESTSEPTSAVPAPTENGTPEPSAAAPADPTSSPQPPATESTDPANPTPPPAAPVDGEAVPAPAGESSEASGTS